MKSLRKKLNKKGFTLVELVVVIAIIGILAAFAVPKFLGFQEDARQNADIATGKQIADIVSVLVSQGEINLPGTGTTTLSIANDGATITSADTTLNPAAKADLVLDKLQSDPKLTSADGKTKVILITLNSAGEITVSAGGTYASTNELYPTPGTDFTD